MIYLTKITPQTLRIPRSVATPSQYLHLFVRPSLGGEWSLLSTFEDNGEGGYYTIAISSCDLPEKEHIYKVEDANGTCLSEGLLVVGADSPAFVTREYSDTNIEYLQYEQ